MSSKIKAKIDCCGSNFETEQVSFFGLLTLSVPVTVVCLILYPFFGVLSFLSGANSIRKNLGTIIKANITLIEKQDLLPKFRCNISVWLSPISKKISLFLYNQFNLISLVFCWALLGTGVSFLV